MIIKYKGMEDDMLGNHDAKKIMGTKVDDGEDWEKKIFANSKQLRDQLDKFGIGDYVVVKQVKQGKFWNITAFEAASPALVESAKNSGGYTKPSGGGDYKKTYTKKEPWVADPNKDGAIARAVALKAAVEIATPKATVPAIIKNAKLFEVYLMDKKDEAEEDPQEDCDALNPPE
jgi:hypothetical protein